MAQNNNQSHNTQERQNFNQNNKKSQPGKTSRQSGQTPQTSERGVDNQPTGNEDLLDE